MRKRPNIKCPDKPLGIRIAEEEESADLFNRLHTVDFRRILRERVAIYRGTLAFIGESRESAAPPGLNSSDSL